MPAMASLPELIQSGTSSAWLFVPTAVLLGALHGLEPRHSKTMMAAFIVAVRGTVAQAILLGLAATLSHTAVVWAVAMGGLYFGRNLDAEASEPYFQVASAALIIAIALWMLWRTWRQSHRHHHDAPSPPYRRPRAGPCRGYPPPLRGRHARHDGADHRLRVDRRLDTVPGRDHGAFALSSAQGVHLRGRPCAVLQHRSRRHHGFGWRRRRMGCAARGKKMVRIRRLCGARSLRVGGRDHTRRPVRRLRGVAGDRLISKDATAAWAQRPQRQ